MKYDKITLSFAKLTDFYLNQNNLSHTLSAYTIQASAANTPNLFDTADI